MKTDVDKRRKQNFTVGYSLFCSMLIWFMLVKPDASCLFMCQHVVECLSVAKCNASLLFYPSDTVTLSLSRSSDHRDTGNRLLPKHRGTYWSAV